MTDLFLIITFQYLMKFFVNFKTKKKNKIKKIVKKTVHIHIDNFNSNLGKRLQIDKNRYPHLQ